MNYFFFVVKLPKFCNVYVTVTTVIISLIFSHYCFPDRDLLSFVRLLEQIRKTSSYYMKSLPKFCNVYVTVTTVITSLIFSHYCFPDRDLLSFVRLLEQIRKTSSYYMKSPHNMHYIII